jgi:hypothetical protein
MRMSRRPFYALPTWRFGRRKAYTLAIAASRTPSETLLDDLRLFLLTFAGGFLFMTVYLA